MAAMMGMWGVADDSLRSHEVLGDPGRRESVAHRFDAALARQPQRERDGSFAAYRRGVGTTHWANRCHLKGPLPNPRAKTLDPLPDLAPRLENGEVRAQRTVTAKACGVLAVVLKLLSSMFTVF